MRVVLDTNVWVSGWLWGGIPGQLIMMADNQQITISASEALLSFYEIPVVNFHQANFPESFNSVTSSCHSVTTW